MTTTMHHPSPQPGLTSFAIYEDPQDREPMSPSELFEGSDSYHSERSFPMAHDLVHSIELQQQEPLLRRHSWCVEDRSHIKPHRNG